MADPDEDGVMSDENMHNLLGNQMTGEVRHDCIESLRVKCCSDVHMYKSMGNGPTSGSSYSLKQPQNCTSTDYSPL